MLVENKKNLLFIPMYNCSTQIVRVINNLYNSSINSYFHTVLFIDNKSTDNTLQQTIDKVKILKDINVKVIQNKNNYSLGGSQKAAFNFAINNNFDYVTILHGDDQGNINDLIPYLENGIAYKFESFLGSRFMKDSKTIGYSNIRILGNYAVNIFCSIMLRRIIKDMGAGLNIYNTQYLKNQFYLYFPNSLNFNVYMLFYGIFVKSNFSFFPLTWREEDQLSNAKVFRQGLEILKLALRFFINRSYLFSNLKSINKDIANISYDFDIKYEH